MYQGKSVPRQTATRLFPVELQSSIPPEDLTRPPLLVGLALEYDRISAVTEYISVLFALRALNLHMIL